MNEPLTPQKLASILKREYDAAEDYASKLRKLQDLSERAYESDEALIPVVEGRSRAMTADVQEVVDYMHNSVLRTQVSGDRTIEFEAVDDSDEQAADDATAAIDFNFMRQQDGYRLLSDACQDGLVRKVGILKTVMEMQEKVTRETMQAIDPLTLGMLPEEIEVESLEQQEDGSFIVELKHTEIKKVFRDYVVPPTQFRFSSNARHEDDADYVGDVDLKTRSELVEMGFDPEHVNGLPKSTGYVDELYELHKSDETLHGEASSKPLERVLLHEEYARIDVDGDGVAERVKVYRVGNEILIDAETGEPSIETVEEQPYSVFCPFPRAHRLVGYSLADKVLDLMIQRSYTLRQMNDGMALSNMPRYEIPNSAIGDNTLQDILTPVPGAPIRTAGPGLREITGSFDASKSLQVMEFHRNELETRSGVTRLNRGLDANAMNKTASGQALLQAQGEQQEEYVARNFAECLSRLFMKKYRLMRRESEPFNIRVDGQYREVDPASWPEDVHIRVRVGLGSNSKDKRMQARFALAEPLQMSLEAGFSDQSHAFNWIDGIMRDAGLGKGEDFMHDPRDPEFMMQQQMKEQEPDPATVDMQMRAAEKQQDREMKFAEMDAKMTMEERKQMREAELARQKLAVETAAKINVSDQRMGGSVAS